eukprot:8960778-Pyramimonas_sp.AAC.1
MGHVLQNSTSILGTSEDLLTLEGQLHCVFTVLRLRGAVAPLTHPTRSSSSIPAPNRSFQLECSQWLRYLNASNH